ncbi:MAG: hypothetical protein RL637_782 [Pseudomonadota bacterium]|jgi:N-ethylmaleimide reductase
MTPDLFSPIQVGPYCLSNRIVMAPLTRMRAPESIPTPTMVAYYGQRATAGLIITEGTTISPQAIGYPCVPGIYTSAQTNAWKKVTQAIHAQKGHIFLQLWHVGRISHPDYHQGELPVAPSALAARGKIQTLKGMKTLVTPRALATEEISGIVEQYRIAAKNALTAGFDGVEIHAANGYLLDQFLRDGSNQRTDQYGGSFENRCRLLLEVTQAVIKVWGAERVGIRLSPSSTFNDMSDSDPARLFAYLLGQLNRFDLAYLHLINTLDSDKRHQAKKVDLAALRHAYLGTVIICGGYTQETADLAIAEELADAIAFGSLYIANPDLVKRFKFNAPLNKPDTSTFYHGGEKGYIDYPFLNY